MISETIRFNFTDAEQQRRFHERLNAPEAVEADDAAVVQAARDRMVDVVKRAVLAEREACAKIAHETSAWCRSFSAVETAEMIEAAIRARGETT